MTKWKIEYKQGLCSDNMFYFLYKKEGWFDTWWIHEVCGTEAEARKYIDRYNRQMNPEKVIYID